MALSFSEADGDGEDSVALTLAQAILALAVVAATALALHWLGTGSEQDKDETKQRPEASQIQGPQDRETVQTPAPKAAVSCQDQKTQAPVVKPDPPVPSPREQPGSSPEDPEPSMGKDESPAPPAAPPPTPPATPRARASKITSRVAPSKQSGDSSQPSCGQESKPGPSPLVIHFTPRHPEMCNEAGFRAREQPSLLAAPAGEGPDTGREKPGTRPDGPEGQRHNTVPSPRSRSRARGQRPDPFTLGTVVSVWDVIDAGGSLAQMDPQLGGLLPQARGTRVSAAAEAPRGAAPDEQRAPAPDSIQDSASRRAGGERQVSQGQAKPPASAAQPAPMAIPEGTDSKSGGRDPSLPASQPPSPAGQVTDTGEGWPWKERELLITRSFSRPPNVLIQHLMASDQGPTLPVRMKSTEAVPAPRGVSPDAEERRKGVVQVPTSPGQDPQVPSSSPGSVSEAKKSGVQKGPENNLICTEARAVGTQGQVSPTALHEGAGLSSPASSGPSPRARKTKGSPSSVASPGAPLPTGASSSAPLPSESSSLTPSPTASIPSGSPSSAPAPTGAPSSAPAPTGAPSSAPAPKGAPSSSPAPKGSPSSAPAPTGAPSSSPAPKGSPSSAPAPTGAPSSAPAPTGAPSSAPAPTGAPSSAPAPTGAPSSAPVPTGAPSSAPAPTGAPSSSPAPKGSPSSAPAPKGAPSSAPAPKGAPSSAPAPKGSPSSAPSPTGAPSSAPESKGSPSSAPAPTGAPSSAPASKGAPSSAPTPKGAPSSSPAPKGSPSSAPAPKGAPSSAPAPKGAPSSAPAPKGSPSSAPSPTGAPSSAPESKGSPSSAPAPTGAPSSAPASKGAPSSAPAPTGAPSSAPVPKGAPSSTPASKGAPSSAPASKGAPSSAPASKGAPSSAPVPTGAPSSAPALTGAPSSALVPKGAPSSAPAPTGAPSSAPAPKGAPSSAPAPTGALSSAPAPMGAPSSTPVPSGSPSSASKTIGAPSPTSCSAPVPTEAPSSSSTHSGAPSEAPSSSSVTSGALSIAPAPVGAPSSVPAPLVAPSSAPASLGSPSSGQSPTVSLAPLPTGSPSLAVPPRALTSAESPSSGPSSPSSIPSSTSPPSSVPTLSTLSSLVSSSSASSSLIPSPSDPLPSPIATASQTKDFPSEALDPPIKNAQGPSKDEGLTVAPAPAPGGQSVRALSQGPNGSWANLISMVLRSHPFPRPEKPQGEPCQTTPGDPLGSAAAPSQSSKTGDLSPGINTVVRGSQDKAGDQPSPGKVETSRATTPSSSQSLNGAQMEKSLDTREPQGAFQGPSPPPQSLGHTRGPQERKQQELTAPRETVAESQPAPRPRKRSICQMVDSLAQRVSPAAPSQREAPAGMVAPLTERQLQDSQLMAFLRRPGTWGTVEGQRKSSHPPKDLPSTVAAMRRHLDLGSCVEALAFAQQHGELALAEEVYALMSDNFLLVLGDAPLYRQLSGGDRERILALRTTRGHAVLGVIVLPSIYGVSRSGLAVGYQEAEVPRVPSTSVPRTYLHTFEPGRNAWLPLTLVPEEAPLRGCGLCAMYNYLFLAGGIRGSGPGAVSTNEVFCYNPLTDIWTQVRPMQEARAQLKLVALEGLLYAIGGECLYSMECYDPRTDQWTSRAPLPAGTFPVAHEAVACRGDIYVTGGHLFYRLLKYSPVQDSWAECPYSASHRRSSDMVALGGFLYRFDLLRGVGAAVMRYNTVTGSWSQAAPLPLPEPTPLRCTVLANTIYCLNQQVTATFTVSEGTAKFESQELKPFPMVGKGVLCPFTLTLPALSPLQTPL